MFPINTTQAMRPALYPMMPIAYPNQPQIQSRPNNSYYFNNGQIAQASSSVANQYGIAGSISRAEQTLLGQLLRTGSITLDRNGLNIGKSMAGRGLDGLPFVSTLARSLNQNGLTEALSKANPLVKETLAAGKTKDGLTTLGYSKNTPFGEQARALIFTPFGVVLSGAGTGAFQENQFSKLI